jgi:hypothetical protein
VAVAERRGSTYYELETEQGVRRLEFDPDVFRRRNVRVLVDGNSVASLPFPKPAAPYQEVPVQLDGHDLIAVTWLPTESWVEGLPLRYDVVANGRSLVDGATLEQVRQSAPEPGPPYPRSFYLIDVALWTVLAVGGPGLVVGVARNTETLGWPQTFGVIALTFTTVAAASWLGSHVWKRIKSVTSMSVRSRAIRGWLAVGLCSFVALASFAAILVAARPSSAKSPAPSSASAPPLSVSNETSIAVTLVINGTVLETVPAGVLQDPIPLPLPARPWTIETRSPSGRLLSTLAISVSDPISIYTGRGIRADLSCGRLDVWSGPAPLGPAFSPGPAGDCN